MNKKTIVGILVLVIVLLGAGYFGARQLQRNSAKKVVAKQFAGIALSIAGNTISARGNMLDDNSKQIVADLKDFQINLTDQTVATKTVVHIPAAGTAKAVTADKLKRDVSSVDLDELKADLIKYPTLSIHAYSDVDFHKSSQFTATKIEYTLQDYEDTGAH